MTCPRRRSVHCSLLGIPLALLADLLLLLIVGSVQAGGAGQSAPISPAADWSYPAKFVGQDHVDLKWDPDPYFPTWIVYRDNVELVRFGTAVTFYRDSSAVKGQTYQYKICAERDAAQSCGQPSTVTVGQIHGLLYEYLSWAGDTYQLSGVVTVQPGATLHIGGATVVGTWDAYIRDFDPSGSVLGAIQVDGATIQARLALRNGSSWIDGSTIGGDAPGWVDLSQWSGAALSGNVFTSTAVLNVSSTSGQAVQVHDNTFYAAGLYAGGAGEVRVHGNRFEKGSTVQVDGTMTGAVSGNTFHDSSIAVYSTGYFDVNNNRLRLLALSDGALIVVSSHAPNAGIYGNLLAGYMEGLYGGRGVGISAGADQDSGGIVDIHDNIVTELERGISLAGPIRALIHKNTITHNRTGILVHHWDTIPDPDVAATGNCISGNNRTANTAYAGLTTVGVVTPIAATGNYWGHPSGPTHPDNPGGQGDRIQELDMDWGSVPDPGVVDFSGWLEAHPCSEVDLSVAGVEVVQSVQDLNNSVPLVAGKPTLVRIYADSGMAPEVAGVPVELKVSRDGSLLGTRQATLLARPVTQWDPVRAATDEGVAIRLDGGWLSGTLQLTVTLNPGQAIGESNYDNNQMTYTVGFTERRPLHIGLAPIEYQPLEGIDPRMPVTEELPSLVQFLHKAYPVSEVRVTLLPPVWWPQMMKGSDSEVPRGRQLLRELTYLWSIYQGLEGGGLDQIVGVFPADCDGGGDITMSHADPRWLGGKGLASYICNGHGDLLAHEIGHNLGLYHPCTAAQAANCCDAWHPGPPIAPPLDWPYANASIQEFGYDTVERAILLPVTADVMTYCRPDWLSPYYYRKLFQANGAPQPPLPVPPPVRSETGPIEETGTFLLVGGLVDTAGTVTFDPFWQLTAAQPALDPPDGSGYCLELRDAAQTVLSSRCFNLAFYDYEGGQETDVDSFLAALPLDPTASRVVLRQGATVLGETVASAHAPQVTLLAPNTGGLQSGKIDVQWTAQDADAGHELAFGLSYSPDDGATWLPFAANLTGTNSFELDLGNLPGGTACRVKVDVSDGWHNASDVSDASFQVAGKAPVVGILQPTNGAVVTTSLTLQGYGYDLEDGQLAGTSLAWISDRDGPLGTGDTVWDVALTPGPHTLTLQATDGDGASRSATVLITVQEGETGASPVYLPIVLRKSGS